MKSTKIQKILFYAIFSILFLVILAFVLDVTNIVNVMLYLFLAMVGLTINKYFAKKFNQGINNLMIFIFNGNLEVLNTSKRFEKFRILMFELAFIFFMISLGYNPVTDVIKNKPFKFTRLLEYDLLSMDISVTACCIGILSIVISPGFLNKYIDGNSKLPQ